VLRAASGLCGLQRPLRGERVWDLPSRAACIEGLFFAETLGVKRLSEKGGKRRFSPRGGEKDFDEGKGGKSRGTSVRGAEEDKGLTRKGLLEERRPDQGKVDSARGHLEKTNQTEKALTSGKENLFEDQTPEKKGEGGEKNYISLDLGRKGSTYRKARGGKKSSPSEKNLEMGKKKNSLVWGKEKQRNRVHLLSLGKTTFMCLKGGAVISNR